MSRLITMLFLKLNFYSSSFFSVFKLFCVFLSSVSAINLRPDAIQFRFTAIFTSGKQWTSWLIKNGGVQTHRIVGIRCRRIRGAVLADLMLTLATSSRDFLGAERLSAYPAVVPAACLAARFWLSGTSNPINFIKRRPSFGATIFPNASSIIRIIVKHPLLGCRTLK